MYGGEVILLVGFILVIVIVIVCVIVNSNDNEKKEKENDEFIINRAKRLASENINISINSRRILFNELKAKESVSEYDENNLTRKEIEQIKIYKQDESFECTLTGNESEQELLKLLNGYDYPNPKKISKEEYEDQCVDFCYTKPLNIVEAYLYYSMIYMRK